MKVLITGGAGFIGRWTVNKFLAQKHDVWVLDDLSNGSRDNLMEFARSSYYHGLIRKDISKGRALEGVFDIKYDLCVHLAARINVQESLDNPDRAFAVNVVGTYNILNQALKHRIKLVIVGTCMVYDLANSDRSINEAHPVKPLSPYAGTKLMAEDLALAYYHGFGLPVVILRPFNVYGPFQKSDMEGGVVAIFIKRTLNGEPLEIYGDGTQTRDLLYVEDCAEFIYEASVSDRAVGEIINAGSGTDISINDLALMISNDPKRSKHVEHIHIRSEIKKLLCDHSKAKKLLGWAPKVDLRDGIMRTTEWMMQKK